MTLTEQLRATSEHVHDPDYPDVDPDTGDEAETFDPDDLLRRAADEIDRLEALVERDHLLIERLERTLLHDAHIGDGFDWKQPVHIVD